MIFADTEMDITGKPCTSDRVDFAKFFFCLIFCDPNFWDPLHHLNYNPTRMDYLHYFTNIRVHINCTVGE